MTLEIKLLRSGAQMPVFATAGAAGLDLHACLDEPFTLPPDARAMIPTGLAIALPESTVGLVYVRSSLAVKHGLSLTNAVGVIDEDYRGELLVALSNHSAEPYTIHHGDRIAQLVVTPYFRPALAAVDVLSETRRGTGGFGSTGV
jgi:deoxyuridine 5''-triphosphate nucleotidohydrolase (dut)